MSSHRRTKSCMISQIRMLPAPVNRNAGNGTFYKSPSLIRSLSKVLVAGDEAPVPLSETREQEGVFDVTGEVIVMNPGVERSHEGHRPRNGLWDVAVDEEDRSLVRILGHSEVTRRIRREASRRASSRTGLPLQLVPLAP